MTAQQNCRSSPFMQLKNNKKMKKLFSHLKKIFFFMLGAEVSLSYSLRKEPAVQSCGMTADTSACQTAAG